MKNVIKFVNVTDNNEEDYPAEVKLIVDVVLNDNIDIELVHELLTQNTRYDLAGCFKKSNFIRYLILDDDYSEVEDDIKEEIEEAVKTSIIRNLGIFGAYASAYEKYLMKNEDMRIFDEGHIQDVANSFEDDYEEYSIEDLLELTSEDIEKDVENAIKELSD